MFVVCCVFREREQPPRFAQPGSFEYEFGLKWKTLYQMLHEQQELLKKNFEDEVSKMEMDMEAALMEQHTALLRQGLFYDSVCVRVCVCVCVCVCFYPLLITVHTGVQQVLGWSTAILSGRAGNSCPTVQPKVVQLMTIVLQLSVSSFLVERFMANYQHSLISGSLSSGRYRHQCLHFYECLQ